MAYGLFIDVDSVRVSAECAFQVSESFETVTLPEVAKSVLGREIDDLVEVDIGFVPLLLEDVNLAAGDTCFCVTRVLTQCFRQYPQRPIVVINSSVGNRHYDVNSLSVVGTLF